ncbi:MAG: M24 family metallopeptidase [Negativicutes bacterium]
MSLYGKLTFWMQEQGLDALLISKRTNIRYFSGFAGSAGVLVITATQRKIFVDFRYVGQAALMAPDFEIVRSRGNPMEAASDFLLQQGFCKIGFENETMTVAEWSRLTAKVPVEKWASVQLDGFRTIKTAPEIAKIVKAAAIADAALEQVLPLFRPGISEQKLAAALEYEMRQRGSERTSFETILASGPRSALPHGAASSRTLSTGDFVVIDFGAVYEGYHSDVTRTVCVGKASSRQREIYEIVLSAQLAGLAAIRSGVLCREVDQTARTVIESAGFGSYFGHGLGHSVGLEIHENPRLSPTAGEETLSPGMVVTVEPGIYLPAWGGVRIEDLVVVTDSGCRILSQTSKSLQELD